MVMAKFTQHPPTRSCHAWSLSTRDTGLRLLLQDFPVAFGDLAERQCRQRVDDEGALLSARGPQPWARAGAFQRAEEGPQAQGWAPEELGWEQALPPDCTLASFLPGDPPAERLESDQTRIITWRHFPSHCGGAWILHGF